MSDVIQCPQCDKKFRLPPNPPATYACSGCGTLMDLSDFGGADAAPPEPDGAAEGAPRGRRSRARGGGRRSAAPPPPPPAGAPGRRGAGPRRRARGSRGRRGRAAPAEDYYEEEGRPSYRGRRRQGPNTALIVGSLAAFVAAVIVVIVVSSKGGDGGGTQKAQESEKDPRAGKLLDANATGAAGAGKAQGDEPTADAAEDEGAEAVAAGKRAGRGKRIRLSKVELKQFPWPEEVDEATRTKVDEAIQNLYRGGRDALDAKDYLVTQGRPICGRIISEFKAIVDAGGLENMDGKSKLGALDSLLRKIDGWIERRWEERQTIKPHSTPSFVLGQLRRWTYWWESDEWKINPRDPWDPMVDESDETEDGIARPLEPPEKDGYERPAGR